MKAVFFDLDGVLIDSEIYFMNGIYNWMKNLGYNGNLEDIYKVIGTSLEETYNIISDFFDNKYSVEELKDINENYFKENSINFNDIKIDGSLELMKYLHESNIKIAVCSSSPKDYLYKALSDLGVIDYIEFFISGETLKRTKPYPDIYLMAKNKLNLESKDCIVIEDSTIGIEAGKNADMCVIALKDKRFSLDQSKADYIVNDYNEIKLLISKLL